MLFENNLKLKNKDFIELKVLCFPPLSMHSGAAAAL